MFTAATSSSNTEQPTALNLKRLESLPGLKKLNPDDVHFDRNGSPLGSGVSADVYPGTLGMQKILVAVKRIRPEIAQIHRSWLMHEYTVWSSLSDAHIVIFYGMVEAANEEIQLVSERMAGNLKDLALNSLSPAPWPVRIGYALDVASALAYLHRPPNGCVHRDIKAENIFISLDRKVAKLADFGHARLLSTEMSYQSLLPQNDVLGTPGFMAPELSPGTPITPAADIYSFGITLFEILAPGYSPQSHPSPPTQQTLDDHLGLLLPSQEYFWDLINDCCQRDPSNRPTAPQVCSRIGLLKKHHHALDTRSVSPSSSDTPSSSVTPSPSIPPSPSLFLNLISSPVWFFILSICMLFFLFLPQFFPFLSTFQVFSLQNFEHTSFQPLCSTESMQTFGSHGTINNQFTYPTGLTVGPDDDLYICDYGNHRIQVHKPDGTLIRSFGKYGTKEKEFDRPLYLSFSPDGKLFVSDHNNRIQVLTADGHYLQHIDLNTTPFGIAFSDDGTMFVCECHLHRISVFSSNNAYLYSFGTHGTSPQQFDCPWGITFGPDNLLYIADHYNHRIQVFSSDGIFNHSFGSHGVLPGLFNHPRSLEFYNGFLYISDFSNHRVQVWTAGGSFVSSFGTPGNATGQFQGPWGLAFNKVGQLFVSEESNHRIQSFRSRCGQCILNMTDYSSDKP